MSDSCFGPQAMFDFVWWAKHVLGASISIGGTTIRVYLGGYPDKAECKSDIVFEVNTGKVYSNYPEVQWLSANDPEEWRRTLLAGSTVMPPLRRVPFPCDRHKCCCSHSEENS